MILMLLSSLGAVSILFCAASSPLMMMLLIVLQCVLTCFTLFLLTGVSWWGLMFLMVFLTGLMVVYAYICSLIKSVGFGEIHLKSMGLAIVVLILATTHSSTEGMSIDTSMSALSNTLESLDSVYSDRLISLTLIMVLYLLLILLVVVKITSYHQAPMRHRGQGGK